MQFFHVVFVYFLFYKFVFHFFYL
jgi:hypothetical protein